MRWKGFLSFILTLSALSCNPVNPRDEYLLSLLNGLSTTTSTNSFTVATSSKINVTSASVVLYYGTPQLFGFSLVREPTANVTLSFTNAKLAGPITSLVFDSTNYDDVQTINLDSNTLLLETSSLEVSVTSPDPYYNGVTGQIPIFHRNMVISYTGSNFTFKEDQAINSLTPTARFPISTCSVSPAFPSGLSLNTSNCVISGTPSDPDPLPGNTYTITAGDGTNSVNSNITISVEPTVYRIFVTAATYNGNLQGAASDGPAGADLKCNADANKPSTGTYKAMLTTDGGITRRACTSQNCGGGGQNVDWVFISNRKYVRASDSAYLFSPNADGILPASSNSFSNPYTLAHSFDAGATKSYWTGLSRPNFQWTTATLQATNNCLNWTSGAVTSPSTEGGRVGISNATNYTAFRNGLEGVSCATLNHLVCVEQ